MYTDHVLWRHEFFPVPVLFAFFLMLTLSAFSCCETSVFFLPVYFSYAVSVEKWGFEG